MPKKKILVAVLNWGLGHATRSIPLIKALQGHGYEPLIASDGKALDFLRQEFPNLSYYELSQLDITYSRKSAFNFIYLLQRSINWNAKLKKDHALIKEIHQKEELAGIISDGRPYAYQSDIPSVYVTHQLQIKSGIFSKIATQVHRQMISKFDECWVPDFEGHKSVCGSMSQWQRPTTPIRYIGIQSDLVPQKIKSGYDYAGIIAGAEPERSKLEQKLITCFRQLKGNKIIIAGSKLTQSKMLDDQIEIRGIAGRSEVNDVINRAKTIVVRGGYSTIMDLIKLQKPALLVPTPGQTEQLYLANRLDQNKYFNAIKQVQLSAEKIKRFEEHQHELHHVAFTGFDFSKLFSLFEGK